MSELMSSSAAPAERAAASMLDFDAGFPVSASSTSVRRVACEPAPVTPIRANVTTSVADAEGSSDTDDGEMGRALVELGVGGRSHWSELHGDDELICRQIDREQSAEEVSRLHDTRTVRPLDVNVGVERQHRRGIIGRRIGVRQAAAKRTAITHLGVADRAPPSRPASDNPAAAAPMWPRRDGRCRRRSRACRLFCEYPTARECGRCR